MSLTSYRTAPPRVDRLSWNWQHRDRLQPYMFGPVCSGLGVRVRPRRWWSPSGSRAFDHALGRPGNDLLSRALRRSTIGAEGLYGRVRNGIGCCSLAIATRSSKPTFRTRYHKTAGCASRRRTAPGRRQRFKPILAVIGDFRRRILPLYAAALRAPS